MAPAGTETSLALLTCTLHCTQSIKTNSNFHTPGTACPSILSWGHLTACPPAEQRSTTKYLPTTCLPACLPADGIHTSHSPVWSALSVHSRRSVAHLGNKHCLAQGVSRCPPPIPAPPCCLNRVRLFFLPFSFPVWQAALQQALCILHIPRLRLVTCRGP